eukprot:11199547-Lingulodinium_polyedra.AAC.1
MHLPCTCHAPAMHGTAMALSWVFTCLRTSAAKRSRARAVPIRAQENVARRLLGEVEAPAAIP